MAKLNLEELVARATQSKADKFQVRMVEIDREGNTIQPTKKDCLLPEHVIHKQAPTSTGRPATHP